MSKKMLALVFLSAFFANFMPHAFAADAPAISAAEDTSVYKIGVDDVLDINILRPEPLATTLTVSPDGTVTFPYIGNVAVKDRALSEAQEEIQTRLGKFIKDPVVSVSLKESRSRMFYVYGEVAKPGIYPIQQNLTAIRAISLAGGLTKYGSSSQVKILRQGKNGKGNELIKVDVRAVMNGDAKQDVKIEAGDVITVSEGIF